METKKHKNSFFKNKGFNLVELMLAIALIGIIGAVILYNSGDLSAAATNKVKNANATQINKILSTVYAIGGTIGKGASNDIDTTSVDTVVDCLTRSPSLMINEITFSIEPRPNTKAYELKKTDKPYETIHVMPNSKEKP